MCGEMLRLEELGFTTEEIAKILMIARLFKCSRMTIEDIKLVDKQDISAILLGKEEKQNGITTYQRRYRQRNV